MIYGNCPQEGCVVWTPHTHQVGGSLLLVAPVRAEKAPE